MRRFVSFKRKEWAVLMVALSSVIDNSMLRWLRDDILHKFSYPDKLDIIERSQFIEEDVTSTEILEQEYYFLLLVLTGLRSKKYLSVTENFDFERLEELLTNRSKLLNLLQELFWICVKSGLNNAKAEIIYTKNKEVDEVLEMTKKLFAVLNKEEPDQSRPGS